MAQIAPSALVWVGAEGVGQLGSRVAREVERDSRCHSQTHSHSRPLNTAVGYLRFIQAYVHRIHLCAEDAPLKARIFPQWDVLQQPLP